MAFCLATKSMRDRFNRLRKVLSSSAAIPLALCALAPPADAQQMLSGASLPRVAPEESKPKTPGVWQRSTLLGDWWGLRPLLDDYGVDFTLHLTSDYVGNTQGGVRQGFVYNGLLNLEVDYDLNKGMGWRGAKLHLTGYGIQGQDLSSQYVGNIMTATNVEATPAIAKVGEFWLEQKLLEDRLQLRAGLLEADRYYAISPTASVFVNSTFGLPDSWEVNMPGEGPGYPNTSTGLLAAYTFNKDWQLTGSVMNGQPAGPAATRTNYGANFPTGNGMLSWLELAYTPEIELADKILPGNYKVGAWYNTNTVDNVTLSTTGRTFTDPVDKTYRGQYSVYGLIDQTLFREANSSTQGLSAFARVTISPQQSRNVVTSYFDLGMAYAGLFNGRPDDILGLGFAWAKFTPYLNSQIAAENALSGTQTPMPQPEQLVELTYQAPISPWLSLQPFFQYAINPGGKAPMPNNPNQAIPNATIVGLRANIAF